MDAARTWLSSAGRRCCEYSGGPHLRQLIYRRARCGRIVTASVRMRHSWAMSGDGKLGRRAFLGAAAAGVAAAVAACSSGGKPAAGPDGTGTARAAATPRRSAPVAENALPGDPHWAIRHLGAEHEIEGYAGTASVRQGESFPLFVSSTSSGYRVTAFRLGWYQGDGARRVWQSGSLRGHKQNGAVLAAGTNTIRTDWDPALDVPTDDWPPGSYLLRLDADSGAQRYVPVTVRSAEHRGQGRAQERCRNLAGLQHLGRLRPVQGPGRGLREPFAGRQPGPPVRRERRGHVPDLRTERGQARRANGDPAGLRDQHGHRGGPASAGRGQCADLARPRRVLVAGPNVPT